MKSMGVRQRTHSVRVDKEKGDIYVTLKTSMRDDFEVSRSNVKLKFEINEGVLNEKSNEEDEIESDGYATKPDNDPPKEITISF